MATVTGIFNTSNFVADHVQKSFAGMITRLMPNGTAALFGLTGMLPSENAVATEHGFFTKTMVFPGFVINGAHLAAATTLLVDDTSNLLPGQIHRLEATNENVIINSVVSATQITVTRGVGSTAANIADNAVGYQIGNAYEEASLRPNSLLTNPVKVTNYTQIFRNTWAISDTVRSTLTIAGDTNIAESKMDCAAFHATAIEQSLFWGTKSATTRNGNPFRTMDGLKNIISANAPAANTTALGSTTTFTQLEAAIDPVFNQTTDPKTANERIMFVGGTAKRVINNIGRLNGTYQLNSGETTWGLQYDTFKLSRGTIRVIEHPLFNTNDYWSKLGVVVDLSTFRIAYLGDRKTQNKEFNMDMQEANDNGIDAVGGTLTTECTCVVKNPSANAWISNFTAAAVG